jgi:hypothetical protein
MAPVHILQPYILILISSSHLLLGSPCGLFPSGFSTRILCFSVSLSFSFVLHVPSTSFSLILPDSLLSKQKRDVHRNLYTKRRNEIRFIFKCFSIYTYIWRKQSSGMCHRVDMVLTDVSEELIASIFRVEGKLYESPHTKRPWETLEMKWHLTVRKGKHLRDWDMVKRGEASSVDREICKSDTTGTRLLGYRRYEMRSE